MSQEHLLWDNSVGQPDTICYLPAPVDDADEEVQDYLVFFLSGNPGLISFYEPFLQKLHALRQSSARSSFHICAHSYRGFEVQPGTLHKDGPFDLQQQIEYQEERLFQHVETHSKTATKPPKVILIGHSVGAYVLLEIISRHKDAVEKEEHKDFDLIGAILLFPTVANIADSPLGKIAKLILPIPGFAVTVGALARNLTSLMPHNVVKDLVRFITKFPEYAAETTTLFLKSPMGVRQALWLAQSEMISITEPTWTKEVWGAATSLGTNERDTINWNNVVYWGEGDGWVANETRDMMIKARGQLNNEAPTGDLANWQPVMKIDKQHIPHDFCTTLKNSNYMAGQVNGWIDGIIEAHDKALAHS